jgi:putative transposase
MPTNLRRVTGRGDLHFITFCCYHRRAFLETTGARDFAVQILGEVRARYGFALVGYVIMPEHVHLMIGEAGAASPADVVQVFKQRVSRFMRGEKGEALGQAFSGSGDGDAQLRRFWQKEKLEYMHANPVVEKLVAHPRDWPWSSWSFYATGQGLLRMDVT